MVNVDTVAMHVYAIPDSLIAPLLSTPQDQRGALLQTLWRTHPETVTVRRFTGGAFNGEHEVSVPLPAAAIRGCGAFYAVRSSIVARSLAPDSQAQSRPLPADVAVRPASEGDREFDDFGLIAQFIGLSAHAKVAGDRGAVFVTRRSANPPFEISYEFSQAIPGHPLRIGVGATRGDGAGGDTGHCRARSSAGGS